MKNNFILIENSSLIFEKWFTDLKTVNHFSTLNISFSNRRTLSRPAQDLTGTFLGPLRTPSGLDWDRTKLGVAETTPKTAS